MADQQLKLAPGGSERPLVAAALERVDMAYRANRTIYLFDGKVVDGVDAGE